jgi:hypothetical protein
LFGLEIAQSAVKFVNDLPLPKGDELAAVSFANLAAWVIGWVAHTSAITQRKGSLSPGDYPPKALQSGQVSSAI